MKNGQLRVVVLCILSLVLVTGCRRDSEPDRGRSLTASYGHDVIHDWNELFLVIDKDALGFRPGPGPRALGYMAIAAYEIALPGMPSFNSLKSLPSLANAGIPSLGKNVEVHYPLAINASYAYLMRRFFDKVRFFESAKGSHITNEQAKQKIEDLRQAIENRYRGEVNDVVFNNSKAWGEEVAQAIWKFSTTDPYGHEAYLNPLNNDPSKPFYYNWRAVSLDANGKRIPGKWTPTNDNPDGGMFPFWGKVRSFVINEAVKICAPPPAYSENRGSEWYSENLQVYTKTTTDFSYEKQWIAEFWSDDLFGLTFAPPPRLVAIMDQILKLKNSNLEEAVFANAVLCITLNDCAVAAWNSKYYYNTERPEHFIKDHIDPNWESRLNHPYTGVRGITPAFPAYPSGHSTFGGGGASAMAFIWGDAITFTDRCHDNRSEFLGKARTFYSFSFSGYENAYSRVPLGVHIEADCREGFALGQRVANQVIAFKWKK